MKKLLFLPVLLFFQSLTAQVYAGGVLLDNTKAERYIQVNPVEKKKQFTFTIECAGFQKAELLTSAQGEPLIFGSLMAGFDFFSRQGWEFISTLSNVSGMSDSPVTTDFAYLFQRQ